MYSDFPTVNDVGLLYYRIIVLRTERHSHDTS